MDKRIITKYLILVNHKLIKLFKLVIKPLNYLYESISGPKLRNFIINSLFILIIISFICLFFISNKDDLLIGNINIVKTIENKGYNDWVITSRIKDIIGGMSKISNEDGNTLIYNINPEYFLNSPNYSKNFSMKSNTIFDHSQGQVYKYLPDVNIPELSISVYQFINLLRDTFRSYKIKMSGEFIEENGGYGVVMRLYNKKEQFTEYLLKKII